MESHPKLEVYLKNNCANCDRISKYIDDKHMGVTKKFVDSNSAFGEELSRDCGCGKVDVPCLREGTKFIHNPDEIIAELNRLQGAGSGTCGTCQK